MTSTDQHIEQKGGKGRSFLAARSLVIITTIAIASTLVNQTTTKTSSSIPSQLPSLRRTSSNETDYERRDLGTTSSDNIFAHQQRSSGYSSGYGYGYGYGNTPNSYWLTNTGGYTVYNQKYSSGGYYSNGYTYNYPSKPSYPTGRYPAPRPNLRPLPFGRVKKWHGGRKKRKKQSCYVKCCRKMRGRRNKKKKCRRRCRKKNNRPKNPCNMNPCPKYPCGTDPCPKKQCPGETITTCARICSPNDGCSFFGFGLGSIQCNLWTAYCEPICQLGRGPPTPLPPTPAPPTPLPPTQSISSRIASGQCECTPAVGDRDNTIDLLGRSVLSENDEESSLVISFDEPPEQDDPPAPPPPTIQSQATPSQTYFLPLREEDMGISFSTASNTNGGSSCGNPTNGNDRKITPTTSIATAIPGTVLWIDHWEDGYETAITDPSSRKASTKVLGDGNPLNGCIEKFRKEASGICNYQCTSMDKDYIEAGEAILLRNLNSNCGEEEIDTRNGRRDFFKQNELNPPPLYFDGSDIVYSSFPIAMTKIQIPGQQGGNLAGGVEITDSKNYGTSFTIPVGRDSDPSAQNKRNPGGSRYNDAFELSDVHVMASQDSTTVKLLDVDGTILQGPFTLRKGDTRVFSNVNRGQQVVASSPVQVDLVTGDLRCTHRSNGWEMRWFALTPDQDRSNTYYTPVSTDNDSHGKTRIWLYNPSASEIRVYYTDSTTNGERSIRVPARGSVSVPTNRGTGTRLSTCKQLIEAKDCTGDEFTALSITDAGTSTGGGDVKDWGAPLQPATQLTSQALVGLGWGCVSKHLPACNTDSRRDNDRICPSDTKHLCCRHHSSGTGSATFSTSQSNSYTKTQNPVWVTPTKNACIFVDFDGPDSNLRDVKHIYVEALDQLLVTDCVDNDMTGAVIYATEPNGSNNCDQAQKDKPVDIAVAWGQKPDLAPSAGALDMGTTVLALPTVGVSKSVSPDGTLTPGQTVRYTIRVTNTGVVDLPADEFKLYDNSAVFFQHATYNPGSTTYRVESSGFGSVGISATISDSSSGTAFPLDDQTNGYTIPVGLKRGDAFVVQYNATVKGNALTGDQVINGGFLIPKTQPIPTDPAVISKIPPAQKFLVQNPVVAPTPAPSPPTKAPSASPSRSPSTSPSNLPTSSPSASPSSIPSASPSAGPSDVPSASPSDSPSTPGPTDSPSHTPSRIPSALPSAVPSTSPSLEPSLSPSNAPSQVPSDVPSPIPSSSPSLLPSSGPSDQPSRDPSESPSDAPSKMPSSSPSLLPSSSPSSEPSRDPSESPSKIPSESPSFVPSASPSSNPSVSLMPSAMPSSTPSSIPSSEPSLRPSGKPTNPPSVSFMPSSEPSSMPSSEPSSSPSSSPSVSPSFLPSSSPSDAPSLTPSASPSSEPSSSPSSEPSSLPSSSPSDVPSLTPSSPPSSQPSSSPSDEPSSQPSSSPSSQPSASPSAAPSLHPSSMPSRLPSSEPSSAPSLRPSSAPSADPSAMPSAVPSASPSLAPSPIPSSSPSSMPSTSPSKSPSARPSLRPSKDPSSAPSSSPSSSPSTSPPTFAPITPFPTPFPTDEPTLPPFVNIQTTCAYSYEIFTDSVPPSPFLVYQYKFRTDSTSCLFVKVQIGYTFEGQLKTVCHGFIHGSGTGEEVLIPDSFCTTARFPSTNTNSPISVVIKYGLAPESECTDSPPASQCTDCSTSLNQEIFSGVSRACEAPEEIAPGEVSLIANEGEGGDYYDFFGGER